MANFLIRLRVAGSSGSTQIINTDFGTETKRIEKKKKEKEGRIDGKN